MRITVTAEHIRCGVPCDGCNCPISLAIREQCSIPAGGVDISPLAAWVQAEDMAPWKRRPLPLEAAEFVRDFDANRPVQPFAFDLPGLEPAQTGELR